MSLSSVMDSPDTSRIDQAWPEGGLERAERCPYCRGTDRSMAHEGVQDWSFFCAPGKWTYWKCDGCSSLYLDPRPTRETLGNAYTGYYTHQAAPPGRSLGDRLKERLRNECWAHWLGADLRPRLHLPGFLRGLLHPLRSRLIEPFEIAELVKLPKGRLMDVGCGNGRFLSLARNLGWETRGLELDSAAVQAARSQGLEVLQGGYELLASLQEELDCIVCSHVLEHVHDPQDMLRTLANALKPGGTLLLAVPNATSLVRDHFGNDWRGLEAPRHLSIPSLRRLETSLQELGFSSRQRSVAMPWTAAESSRIQRRAARVNAHDRSVQQAMTARTVFSNIDQVDFVEFVCVKGACHDSKR
jgi:SAM-dependent methyltransferase